jgi:hypothetical protein
LRALPGSPAGVWPRDHRFVPVVVVEGTLLPELQAGCTHHHLDLRQAGRIHQHLDHSQAGRNHQNLSLPQLNKGAEMKVTGNVMTQIKIKESRAYRIDQQHLSLQQLNKSRVLRWRSLRI